MTLMYNLIENSDRYGKTWGILRQPHRDGPNENITDSEPSEFKARITGESPATSNTKYVEYFN